MIIKKFQGKTEADATEQAKKELGPNVVIMNVKHVKRKGLLAFLKPQMVEVTAALEEENERSAYVKKEEWDEVLRSENVSTRELLTKYDAILYLENASQYFTKENNAARYEKDA